MSEVKKRNIHAWRNFIENLATGASAEVVLIFIISFAVPWRSQKSYAEYVVACYVNRSIGCCSFWVYRIFREPWQRDRLNSLLWLIIELKRKKIKLLTCKRNDNFPLFCFVILFDAHLCLPLKWNVFVSKMLKGDVDWS